jgi:hypothetical protein
MTIALHSPSRSEAASRRSSPLSPPLARGIVVAAVAAAALAGWVATDPTTAAASAARAGEGLTRLMRAMAAIKAAMAVAALAGVLWRLAAPVSAAWLGAYVAAAAAMAAGPGLIWTMTRVALGATLLHAGLIAMLILLWRDPAVGRRLANIVAARRAAINLKGR